MALTRERYSTEVACPPVMPTALGSRPVAERLVEVYFLPFNLEDCASLVAHMTTLNGSAISLILSGM